MQNPKETNTVIRFAQKSFYKGFDIYQTDESRTLEAGI